MTMGYAGAIVDNPVYATAPGTRYASLATGLEEPAPDFLASSSDWDLSVMAALTIGRMITRAQRIRQIHYRRILVSNFYEDLYFKRHWNSPPRDELDYQVVLPIHTIVVNTIHSLMTGMPVRAIVNPNNPTSHREQTVADKMEQWHLAVDQTNTRELGQDSWQRAAFNQALYGVGVFRELYNFSTLSGDDPPYPIVQHALNPKQVYWEFGNPPRGFMRTVFYEFEMTRQDIIANYGVEIPMPPTLKGAPEQGFLEQPLIVLDWWEWIGVTLWHAVFTTTRAALVGIEDEEGAKGENEVVDPSYSATNPAGYYLMPPTPMPDYWKIPYTIFPFYETTSMEPSEWALSPLHLLTDIPHMMEILASRQMRLVEMFADPTVLATRGPNGGDTPIDLQKSPGEVVDLMYGDEVKYLLWPGSPPDITNLWQKYEQITDELSLSQALLAKGSTDATGFRQALDRETSLLKLAKALENYENARADVYATRCWNLNQQSPDDPIPARWVEPRTRARQVLSFTGKQLYRYRDIEVEVKPTFPGDTLRDLQVAQSAVAGKVWSLDDAMEYVPSPTGVPNAARRQRILEDQLEFHPVTLQAQAGMLAQHIQQDQQREAQEAQSGGGDDDWIAQLLGGGQEQAPGGPGGPLPGATPGPQAQAPGLPGMPPSPGQGLPAGSSAASPLTGSMDNRLQAQNPAALGAGNLPQGTVSPDSVAQMLLRQQQTRAPLRPQ